MSNQVVPILLNLLAGLIGAFGQYAYKKGSLKLSEVPILQNYSIWIGVFLFCIVMVLFVMGYKMGGRISVVYPYYATTFIWGALIGKFLEREPMNTSIIGGTLLIIAGLIWIAKDLEVAS